MHVTVIVAKQKTSGLYHTVQSAKNIILYKQDIVYKEKTFKLYKQIHRTVQNKTG